MKFTFKKKATLFYYLAVIFITSILTFTYYNSEKALATNKLLMRTQKVINKNNEVLLNAVNIETGFRGYLLTGDSLFLETYMHSKSEIYANLDTLTHFTHDKIEQQDRIVLLKYTVGERLSFIKKNLLFYNQNNLNNTQKKIVIIEGKKLTDKIRKIISKINKDEYLSFKNRQLDSEKSNYNTNFLFGLLLLSLLTVFILILSIISNQKKRNSDLIAFTNAQKLYSKYTLSLIEASRDPLFTISTEGKITDTNDAAAGVTGVDKAELIGSYFFDYFTEPDKARLMYEQVFSNEFIVDYPLTIVDGILTDVIFNGSV